MWLALLSALMVDRLVGEPEWLWRRCGHPVSWMAGLLMWGEGHLNQLHFSDAWRRSSGIIWILICAIFAGGVALAIEVIVLSTLPGLAALVVLAALASVFLAHKSLIDHVKAVERPLLANELEASRKAVSRIVGRDTSALDEAGVARAGIESLAENYSDGVIAPAFWYLVGGLPGLVVYKLVNTADSMIGHRSQRFEAFGFGAARLDDLLNLVPARLTVLILSFGGAFSGAKYFSAGLRTAGSDAKKHASPNAGWPEAAMAGLLGVRLGGPRAYPDGREKDNAWLGAGRDVEQADLTSALRVVEASWFACCCLMAFGVLATRAAL